eukprot:gnl/TRDRNA2_/TRDRNA2_93051_c0_seq1.p1 gnl/TRDRNA2_/TRDRNA2_93051_c0~~gnl/TRDRNA2_/TRDRNA2_93051_c0_seq1.p1  ORF type:complete len:178 (+),score=24.02 gnl/TRDRNA2_/TRDRNA2_93051_c0_seq1:549-1082(+)
MELSFVNMSLGRDEPALDDRQRVIEEQVLETRGSDEDSSLDSDIIPFYHHNHSDEDSSRMARWEESSVPPELDYISGDGTRLYIYPHGAERFICPGEPDYTMLKFFEGDEPPEIPPPGFPQMRYVEWCSDPNSMPKWHILEDGTNVHTLADGTEWHLLPDGRKFFVSEPIFALHPDT